MALSRDGIAVPAGSPTDRDPIALADINIAGPAWAAARIWDEALEPATAQRHVLRGTADLHAGLAELHWASGGLDLAGQHLMRSEELGEAAGLPQFPHRWRIAMAKLRLAVGDADGALDLLDEAERVYVPDFFPNVRPIAAIKARVLVLEGRLAEAERWQREAGVAATDELGYLREFEHVTLARLLLAQGEDEAALALLNLLLSGAEAGGRCGSVIEISVLQALAHRAGRDNAAGAALDKALTLAAPEGYVRVFVDEGEPMEALIKAAAKRGNAFARSLLMEFEDSDARAPEPHGDPIGLLSERELDVLRLLRGDLDGPDTRASSGVAQHDADAHQNIYEKPGVNSRRAANQPGRRLGLLFRR